MSAEVIPKVEYNSARQTSLMAQTVKHLHIMQETGVWSLSWEDPLEKEKATHSSTLAWKFHGRRSLASYSPWGPKDWATSLSPSARQRQDKAGQRGESGREQETQLAFLGCLLLIYALHSSELFICIASIMWWLLIWCPFHMIKQRS